LSRISRGTTTLLIYANKVSTRVGFSPSGTSGGTNLLPMQTKLVLESPYAMGSSIGNLMDFIGSPYHLAIT